MQTITLTCPDGTCHHEITLDNSLWHQPLIISQLFGEQKQVTIADENIVSIIQKQLLINKDDFSMTCEECRKRGIATKMTVTSIFNTTVTTRNTISRFPPILVVSCVFSSSMQTLQTLVQLLESITASTAFLYSLHSMVCYRGLHYVSICLEGDLSSDSAFWVEYNDDRRTVFHSTEDMIFHCLQSNILPVLLLFSTVVLCALDIRA